MYLHSTKQRLIILHYSKLEAMAISDIQPMNRKKQ